MILARAFFILRKPWRKSLLRFYLEVCVLRPRVDPYSGMGPGRAMPIDYGRTSQPGEAGTKQVKMKFDARHEHRTVQLADLEPIACRRSRLAAGPLTSSQRGRRSARHWLRHNRHHLRPEAFGMKGSSDTAPVRLVHKSAILWLWPPATPNGRQRFLVCTRIGIPL